MSLFTLKCVCLRIKLSLRSALFSFCGVHICAPFICMFSLIECMSYPLSNGYQGSLGMWLGHEVDHFPPSGTNVKNMWNCTSTPAYILMSWRLINLAQGQLYISAVKNETYLMNKFMRWEQQSHA
jgi:hypothetical protein